MKGRYRVLLILVFLGSGILRAESPGGTGSGVSNPFMPFKERYQWAIAEVMSHKGPEEVIVPVKEGSNKRAGKPKAQKGVDTAPAYKTQNYRFQSETDKAKVTVEVTDFGTSYLLDVTSDQAIQGWLLKRQTTREVLLKGAGSPDNPYQLRIRVERAFQKDLGLTLYVTQDSDPAFVQLF